MLHDDKRLRAFNLVFLYHHARHIIELIPKHLIIAEVSLQFDIIGCWIGKNGEDVSMTRLQRSVIDHSGLPAG